MKILFSGLTVAAAMLLAGPVLAQSSKDGTELARSYKQDANKALEDWLNKRMTIRLSDAEFDERRKRVSQDYDRLTISCDCKNLISWPSDLTTIRSYRVDCVGSRTADVQVETIVFETERCVYK